jgi:hypothetical protein
LPLVQRCVWLSIPNQPGKSAPKTCPSMGGPQAILHIDGLRLAGRKIKLHGNIRLHYHAFVL